MHIVHSWQGLRCFFLIKLFSLSSPQSVCNAASELRHSLGRRELVELHGIAAVSIFMKIFIPQLPHHLYSFLTESTFQGGGKAEHCLKIVKQHRFEERSTVLHHRSSNFARPSVSSIVFDEAFEPYAALSVSSLESRHAQGLVVAGRTGTHQSNEHDGA